jgi:hypothetical protein
MTEVSPSEPSMYDAFAEEFLRHAGDGAYNAHYDPPVMASSTLP